MLEANRCSTPTGSYYVGYSFYQYVTPYGVRKIMHYSFLFDPVRDHMLVEHAG